MTYQRTRRPTKAIAAKRQDEARPAPPPLSSAALPRFSIGTLPVNAPGLPERLKSGIEALSGVSMDGVRVRYNSPHPARIGALAYARGCQIHLAAGQEKHLPHEAWHLVQQARGRVHPSGRASGLPLNEDPTLEAEADRMGALRGAPVSAAPGPLPSSSAQPAVAETAGLPVVQRKLTIVRKGKGKKTYGPNQLPPRNLVNTAHKRAMWDKMAASEADHSFASESEYNRAVAHAAQRKQWWNNRNPNNDAASEINRLDPKFKEIEHEVLTSHRENPYSADALHEGGPLMSSYMHGDKTAMAGALLNPMTYLGRSATSRPDIEITKIEMIKREALRQNYAAAKADILNKQGGVAANERYLYSGHGVAGMTHIAQHGHDPAYGQYDPPGGYLGGKGHGAHGRGSYFSDQVDKALSYSSAGQTQGEARSFFRQKVLLGNQLNYGERGKYRYRHHNEMVRTARNPVNTTRNEGDAAPPTENMAQYDSLVGAKSYEPGSGLFGTAYHRSQFDSNEYMVRNADQILPKYRIYYRLK